MMSFTFQALFHMSKQHQYIPILLDVGSVLEIIEDLKYYNTKKLEKHSELDKIRNHKVNSHLSSWT